MMNEMITSVAIVAVKPTAKAMKNNAIASATNRYPTRLASSVHLAMRARLARTGSMGASWADIQSSHATSASAVRSWGRSMTVGVELLGEGSVLLLTLDRPSKRNAVDHQTLLEAAGGASHAHPTRRRPRAGLDGGCASGGDHRDPSRIQRRG